MIDALTAVGRRCTECVDSGRCKPILQDLEQTFIHNAWANEQLTGRIFGRRLGRHYAMRARVADSGDA